jgi:hypothetical protein
MTSAFNIFLSTNPAQISVGFGMPAAWTRRGMTAAHTGRNDIDVLAASGAG